MAIDIRATGSRPATLRLLFGFGAVAALYAVSDTPIVAVAFLPVRNVFRSFEVIREQSSGFVVEDYGKFRHFRERIVAVQTIDGKNRRIAATGHSYGKFLSAWPRTGKRNEADEICDQLNAWLHQSPGA